MSELTHLASHLGIPAVGEFRCYTSHCQHIASFVAHLVLAPLGRTGQAKAGSVIVTLSLEPSNCCSPSPQSLLDLVKLISGCRRHSLAQGRSPV